MKPENIKKVKEAISDEYGIDEKVAEFCAKSILEGVGKALSQAASKILEGVLKDEGN